MFRFAAILTIGLATPLAAQNAQTEVEPSRITVKMMPGITSSAQLPTPALVNARKALTQGQSIYTSQMRQIADLGDGFAAFKFAEWLAAAENAQQSDIAHYYGMAAATGRLAAFNRLVETLDHMEPADLPRARSNVLEGIIFAYARAGNSRAVDAVIRYHRSQRPFGRLDSEIETLLRESHGETAASIALHLALTILQSPTQTPNELERAEAYLEIAATSESLETQLVAANLAPMLEQALAAQPTLPSEATQ
ncbi:hypothetical protein [Loktanella sp. S4079]|uniref:hypothetical protein n=1 Tax=Loktanella sp. S4079 TaxID=579483 RepID=UPI0005FA169C|nr:hypothetical protein [Loktanella sp. S4079]KJZ19331.1 hypothetical protein TW80_11180 [Loktanella sp. S4079]